MRLAPGLAALTLTALLTACSAASDRVTDPPTVDAPTTGTTQTPTPAPTASGDIQTIEVSYLDGAVAPRALKPKVPVGAKIRLVVRADVSDEVHVHTYDKKAVLSGGVATITLTADIPGIFEVELEDNGVVLLNLQVG